MFFVNSFVNDVLNISQLFQVEEHFELEQKHRDFGLHFCSEFFIEK